MMITKAQVELVKTLKYSNEPVTEALSALIAVGERLADQTHVLIPTKTTNSTLARIGSLLGRHPSENETAGLALYDILLRNAQE